MSIRNSGNLLLHEPFVVTIVFRYVLKTLLLVKPLADFVCTMNKTEISAEPLFAQILLTLCQQKSAYALTDKFRKQVNSK
jgi:hypothetical protein